MGSEVRKHAGAKERLAISALALVVACSRAEAPNGAKILEAALGDSRRIEPTVLQVPIGYHRADGAIGVREDSRFCVRAIFDDYGSILGLGTLDADGTEVRWQIDFVSVEGTKIELESIEWSDGVLEDPKDPDFVPQRDVRVTVTGKVASIGRADDFFGALRLRYAAYCCLVPFFVDEPPRPE